MSSADDETEYDLVMPFVVVQSKGGPYDDDAYVAGWELGKLDEQLERAAEGREWSHIMQTLHTTNVGQADLLAMHHGFTTTAEATDYPEWMSVMFSPPVEWRPDRWDDTEVAETGDPS